MPSLPPHTLHVALARIPVETAAALEARALPRLSDDERERYATLRAPSKRREFLITRVLVRSELSRWGGLPAEAWRFRTNEYGRPEIANEGCALRFNVSNTNGLVAIVVAEGPEVGVDVEDTRRESATVAIADRFFSPTEVRELRSLPEGQQRDRFFDYWTLKESYIKARGMGLAIPLDQFSFRFDPLRIELDPRVGNDATSWQFWLQRPTVEHRLAVAARCVTRPSLIVEWVTPLGR